MDVEEGAMVYADEVGWVTLLVKCNDGTFLAKDGADRHYYVPPDAILEVEDERERAK